MKLSNEYVKNYIDGCGYTLLTEYTKSSQKMTIRCDKGHEYKARWNDFRSGHRCPYCAVVSNHNKSRHSYAYVYQTFEKAGYQLISDQYTNAFALLQYRCPNGHVHSMSFSNFRQGNRCPECSRISGAQKRKYSIEYVKQFFLDNGCIPLFDEYVNNTQKLKYQCSCGSIGETAFAQFLIGHRCLNCRYQRTVKSRLSNDGFPVSAQQIYIHQLIGGQMNYQVGNSVLDIAFPEEKIYIEYDGSGHRLSVVLGDKTDEQFDENEKKRSYALMWRGWKCIRIKSLRDKLPSDEVILELVRKGKEYLQNHSYFYIDIDNGLIKTSQYEEPYLFEKTKRITRSAVTTENHIGDNMVTANPV